MGKSSKFYTVWKGHHTGVFDSWKDCKAQITDYKGAVYKSFKSFDEAKKAYKGNYRDYIGAAKKPTLSPKELERIGHPNLYSISVDAASSGNPGKMEYRGVDTQTSKELFRLGPFKQGTNNIGEFLAIVHGLAYLKQLSSDRILYTDSRTALSWIKHKKCNTKLKRNSQNQKLFELVDRAVHWLKTNHYKTTIVKWETKAWGEIPADFGRK